MKITDEDIYELLKNKNLSEEDKKTIAKMLGQTVDDNENKSKINSIEDNFSMFVGSWSFIILSVLFILCWMFINSFVLPKQYVFDEFPYVLLNLVLACIAAIQAPIIMMSQNRQDKRESLKTQSDYEIDLKTIVIIQDLHKKTTLMNKKLDKLLEIKGDDNEF